MKNILKHLFFIALSSVALLLLILLSLKYYTRHGQSQNVPNVVEMRSDKAMRLLESEGLIPVIVDSVFVENFPKLGIVDQNPDADSKVKKDRKIYLIVNSLDVPMVDMPDIAGKSSLRQARNQLAVVGLRIGSIIEKPDPTVKTEFDQPVLEQLFDDERILPGTPVKKFSEIDLVVGKMIESRDSSSIETMEDKEFE